MWGAVLSRQTPQARQMLRKLLDGKIAVEPVTRPARLPAVGAAERRSAAASRSVEGDRSDDI